MKMHQHKLARTSLVAACVAVLALGIAGCNMDDQDPTIATSEAVSEATDAIHTMDGVRFGELGILDARVPGMHLGLRCDATPDITEVEVCGQTVPASAHFEWTDCAMPGPRGGGEMKHPGMTPPTSKGTIDVTKLVEPANPDACTADASSAGSGTEIPTAGSEIPTAGSEIPTAGSDLKITENVTFAIERTGHCGMSGTLTGSAQSTSLHAVDADSFTRTTTLDVTRERKDDDGEVIGSVHLTGTIDATVDLSGDAPSRTLNGTLNAEHDDGETAVITLTNVVRTAPDVCRWPTSGTLERTVSGTTSTVVFGPSCGEATLDGEAIELDMRHRGDRMGGGR